jgi:dienelactone hydrolase
MRTLLCVLIGLLGIPSAGAAGAAAALDFAAYAGNYRIGVDHVVAIAEWELDPGSPHLLAFTDLRTGRFGVLTEAGKDEVTLAAGLMSGPEAARLRFERVQGRVTALTLTEPGQRPRRAERIADRRLEMTVDAGSVPLQGTLWLPPGKGPFPAIVLVPAGALGRTAPATFTNFFLGEGFAVLAYDRRTGREPFETYAADALAAVEGMRRRPGVDPGRVGLWGHSQGGWLSLMAAAGAPSVAFVIDHSGMLVPAWQQELYRLAAEATADGVPPDVVQEAVAFETRLLRVAETGEGWPEIAAALAIAPAPPWQALVYKPASLAELQGVWRNDFSFDPRPFAARVRQPVLALFGGLDRSTPIESAANLVHAVGPGGKVTVEFFPTADHAFLEAHTGGNAEIPRLTRFAPGMFESMRRWLGRVAHLSRRGRRLTRERSPA